MFARMTDTHNGVSCDACKKTGFRGRRFKCLVCYDFDLCGVCYEAQKIGSQHTADHAMQCILTRSDMELFYGGESIVPDKPQAFACPYCKRLGLNDVELLEHINVEHSSVTQEVVCPVCAALPGGEPNRVTDQLATHLALDHGRRDAIASAESGRRGFQPSLAGRGGIAGRTRRANVSSGLAQLASRDAIDPIAELLSQLGGIRRNAAAVAVAAAGGGLNAASTLSHTHHFQQMARMPRRPHAPDVMNGVQAAALSDPYLQAAVQPSSLSNTSDSSKFLLPRILAKSLSDSEKEISSEDRRGRVTFVEEHILLTLADDEPDAKGERRKPTSCLPHSRPCDEQTIAADESQTSDSGPRLPGNIIADGIMNGLDDSVAQSECEGNPAYTHLNGVETKNASGGEALRSGGGINSKCTDQERPASTNDAKQDCNNSWSQNGF